MDELEDEKRAAFERRRAEMMRLIERHFRSASSPSVLADDACISRFHFQRVFRQVMGETPADLQRRLRLERAAHDLQHTPADVTTIAFDAGYASLEGFSRAFRRAYGQSPSGFRTRPSMALHLPGASYVHFDAPTSGLRAIPRRGVDQMDLVDRLLDNDYRAKRSLLESAHALTDAQLDASLLFRIKLEPWREPDASIRQALDRLTDMGWVAGMLTAVQWPYTGEGWRMDDGPLAAHSVGDMITRLDSFYQEYVPFVQHVKEQSLWETTWIDSACEPAETFTYASVIEAGLERGVFHRMVAARLLEQAGVAVPWWG